MSFDFVENFTVQLPDFSKADFDFSEEYTSNHGLIIEVAAIHEGLTANYNNYSADELEKALESWVEPYPKPIILNHDLSTEPIGRVIAAKMDKEQDGSSFVRLQIAITDPVAAEKVMDKRYLTGSVGGRASKAVCSISGEDLAQETDSGRPRMPKFKRGKVYKGKLAYIDMQDISFKEYSFVNQPADQKSGVRSAKKAGEDTPIAASDDWVAKSSAFVLHMDSEDIVSIEEKESIFKSMKKKDLKTIYLQTKGAFLSAVALHESESDINAGESLLSNEDLPEQESEEISIMKDTNKDEDILAVATGLSEDLSAISSAEEVEEQEAVAEEDVAEAEEISEETPEATDEVTEEVAEEEEVVEPSAEEEAVEEGSAEEISVDDAEEAEVQSVDSENAAEPTESSEVEEADDEVQEDADQDGDLTTEESSDEQNADQLTSKVKLLEEEVSSLKDENSKLKSALHMTLVERVVDTKIALGLTDVEQRDEAIQEHAPRTASSLADSLRDLAALPVKASKRVKDFLTSNEFEVETPLITEDFNASTVDDEEISESDPVDSLEQLFVDTLMGRRKL